MKPNCVKKKYIVGKNTIELAGSCARRFLGGSAMTDHNLCHLVWFSQPLPGRGLSGGGVQGGWVPPAAKMQHIGKGLQKCTTLTHSAYAFVILSEDRQCNSSFWVHTLCPHLNTTRKHKQETRRKAQCHQMLCKRSIRVGLFSWSCLAIMAACLTNSHRAATGVFGKSVEHALCAALFAFSSHSICLESGNRGSRL